MLFLFTIFVVILGVAALAILAKRLTRPNLQAGERPYLNTAENFRPLFAPSEDALRADELEAAARVEAEKDEEDDRRAKQKLANFDEFRQTWRTSANRTNTIELLYQGSQSADGKIYLEVCDDVLKAWKAGTLADLSADDLAQIIESHFWLIPANERTPGVSFRLKEEIAGLRRVSVKNK